MSRDIPIIFIRRPSTCVVCKRPDAHLSVINGTLRKQARNGASGRGVRYLGSVYSLSVTSLRRHRDQCLALASVYAPRPRKATKEEGKSA